MRAQGGRNYPPYQVSPAPNDSLVVCRDNGRDLLAGKDSMRQ